MAKKKEESKDGLKFSDTIMNFAMIVKGDIDDIKVLKKLIEKEINKKDNKKIKFIYQKTSPKRLWIKEEGEIPKGG